jgi:hypothetical protein
MRLAHANYTAVSGGVQADGAFTIKASATAFYVMMSGIARDKVAYPVREYCTNAWDAAGGDFDVYLPTMWDSTFRVRDFGPGLSHDAVTSIFTRMFESTKDGDNDQVGGLGLGCKSAFAYLIRDDHLGAGAGSFTVRSFQNGEVRTYVMSLASDGCPRWQLLAYDTSDEREGLEVSFAVQVSDVQRFKDAAFDILWSFVPRARVHNGYAWGTPEVLMQGDGWVQYKQGSVPFTGPAIRMGCVRYAIDPIILGRTSWPWARQSILFDVPIGSVSVQASRESLAYDDRTISTLNAVLDRFEHDAVEEYRKIIAPASSVWHAAYLLDTSDQPHSIRSYLLKSGLIQFKGLPVFEAVTVIPQGALRMLVWGKGESPSWAIKQQRDAVPIASFHSASGPTQFIIEDLSKTSYTYERLALAGLSGERFVWLRYDRGSSALDTLLGRLGLTRDDCIDLNKIKRPRQLRGAKQSNSLRLRCFDLGSAWRGRTSSEVVDLAAGGVYVIVPESGVARNVVFPFGTTARPPSYFIDCYRELGRDGASLSSQRVVIIKEEQTSKFIDPLWRRLDHWMKELFEQQINFSVSVTGELMNFGVDYRYVDIAESICKTPLVPDDIKEFAELVVQTSAAQRQESAADRKNRVLMTKYEKFCQVFGYLAREPDSVVNPVTEIGAKLTALKTKYPLFHDLVTDAWQNYSYRDIGISSATAAVCRYFYLYDQAVQTAAS